MPQTVVLATVSISSLQAAINTGANNIVIPNGIYTKLSGFIVIPGNNVTIEAAEPGCTSFSDCQLSFGITGNNCTIMNLQFLNTAAYMGVLPKSAKGFSAKDLISISGSNNTITGVNINHVYASHYINVYGTAQDTEISYTNIENKPMDDLNVTGTALINSMIELQGNPTTANHHWIHHCTFCNMDQGNDSNNRCESIRVGDINDSSCTLNTLVEHCVFENVTAADSEIISINSRNNVIRYNTFSNNSDSCVSFRNGNDNVYYGNFHLSSGGVRFEQASNISVYNNYFENCSHCCEWVLLHYQDDLKASGTQGPEGLIGLLYHKNINVQHNTFYNCGAIRVNVYDISANCFANNLLVQDKNENGQIPLMSGNLTPIGDVNNFTVVGNMYIGGPIHVNNLSGFLQQDPVLVRNTQGYSSITDTSPAVGFALNPSVPLLFVPNITTDNSLQFDITGAVRSPNSMGNNDAGCFQVNVYGTAFNLPLTLNMVGPSYL